MATNAEILADLQRFKRLFAFADHMEAIVKANETMQSDNAALSAELEKTKADVAKAKVDKTKAADAAKAEKVRTDKLIQDYTNSYSKVITDLDNELQAKQAEVTKKLADLRAQVRQAEAEAADAIARANAAEAEAEKRIADANKLVEQARQNLGA